jgi:hypothetical protein
MFRGNPQDPSVMIARLSADIQTRACQTWSRNTKNSKVVFLAHRLSTKSWLVLLLCTGSKLGTDISGSGGRAFGGRDLIIVLHELNKEVSYFVNLCPMD